jgi:hypothetical protein
MVHCSNCGQKLEEKYNFCPKCGTRTGAGITAGVADPWEDVKKALAGAMEEMNKAFARAAEETKKAFEEAKKEAQWQASSRRKIECQNCGAPNMAGSKFCSKCGKPLK